MPTRRFSKQTAHNLKILEVHAWLKSEFPTLTGVEIGDDFIEMILLEELTSDEDGKLATLINDGAPIVPVAFKLKPVVTSQELKMKVDELEKRLQALETRV